MPMAEYADFDDCVAQNGDKSDPSAYCGAIKHKVEGMSVVKNIASLLVKDDPEDVDKHKTSKPHNHGRRGAGRAQGRAERAGRPVSPSRRISPGREATRRRQEAVKGLVNLLVQAETCK